MHSYSGFQTAKPKTLRWSSGEFIGLETAEKNLVHRGFEVILVEMVIKSWLHSIRKWREGRLERHGVRLALNDGVAGFKQADDNPETRIRADIVESRDRRAPGYHQTVAPVVAGGRETSTTATSPTPMRGLPPAPMPAPTAPLAWEWSTAGSALLQDFADFGVVVVDEHSGNVALCGHGDHADVRRDEARLNVFNRCRADFPFVLPS